MGKRNFNEANISEAFFPVEERPLAWIDKHKKYHNIENQKVLIDVKDDKPISVVSSQYHIIQNEEAYRNGDYVVKGVFDGHSLADFAPYNVYMPSTKGACRIDMIMRDSPFMAFGDKNESYNPFVRISNSYNRTLALKYEIGFCRWICLNGCIFGQKGVTFFMTHNERLDDSKIHKWIAAARTDIGDIAILWHSFEAKIKILSDIRISTSDVLPIFCRTFDVHFDSENFTKRQTDNLAEKGKLIKNTAMDYFEELGYNAYALFNAFTDYASYSAAKGQNPVFVHGYQRKVGDWVDDTVKTYRKGSFSLENYLNEKDNNSAIAIEELIQHQK